MEKEGWRRRDGARGMQKEELRRRGWKGGDGDEESNWRDEWKGLRC